VWGSINTKKAEDHDIEMILYFLEEFKQCFSAYQAKRLFKLMKTVFLSENNLAKFPNPLKIGTLLAEVVCDLSTTFSGLE
jgi:hypothetical protein